MGKLNRFLETYEARLPSVSQSQGILFWNKQKKLKIYFILSISCKVSKEPLPSWSLLWSWSVIHRLLCGDNKTLLAAMRHVFPLILWMLLKFFAGKWSSFVKINQCKTTTTVEAALNTCQSKPVGFSNAKLHRLFFSKGRTSSPRQHPPAPTHTHTYSAMWQIRLRPMLSRVRASASLLWL